MHLWAFIPPDLPFAFDEFVTDALAISSAFGAIARRRGGRLLIGGTALRACFELREEEGSDVREDAQRVAQKWSLPCGRATRRVSLSGADPSGEIVNVPIDLSIALRERGLVLFDRAEWRRWP